MNGLGTTFSPNINIAVVDHDPIYLEWLANVLSDLGYQVTTHISCEAAAMTISSTVPHLLLLDYEMTIGLGNFFVDEIRQKQPQVFLPVIYLLEPTSITPLLRQISIIDTYILRTASVPELAERIVQQLKFHNLPEVLQELSQYTLNYRSHAPMRMEITALFADVRGFTSFSENHDPETVAAILNSMFEIMARYVLNCGGIIDKYIGDSIMAIFGYGPESQPNHAEAALTAADAIMNSVTAELNNNPTLSRGTPLSLGIGIHTGMAVIGPIGASFRRDMTAIGGSINMASRLCAKAAPGEILISEEIYHKIAPLVRLISCRNVNLKGLGEQTVYSVRMGLKSLSLR